MKNRVMNRMMNQRGMTLIEIMIVIAIIAGLMAVMGNQAVKYLNDSKVKQAKIQIKNVSQSLEAYNLDCNSYPSTDQGLQALVQNPGAETCPNWRPDGYEKKVPQDPWGAKYVYESDGGKYILKSLGKNRREGGDGYDRDISSEDADM